MRSVSAIAVAIAVVSRPCCALTAEQCVEAHVAAQQFRAESKLLEAREELANCGAEECPGILRKECGLWQSEIERQLPSIIMVALSADGGDVPHARFRIDDSQVALGPGTIVALNPGSHRLTASADGFDAESVGITAVMSERERRITVVLRPKAASAPNWPYFALGGGVLLGAGVFVGVGAFARSEEQKLETCRPSCPASQVSDVRTEYLVANIGVGLAAVSLAAGGAYYFFNSGNSVGAKASATSTMVYFRSEF